MYYEIDVSIVSSLQHFLHFVFLLRDIVNHLAPISCFLLTIIYTLFSTHAYPLLCGFKLN